MARRFLIDRHELRMGRAELQAVGKGEKRSFLCVVKWILMVRMGEESVGQCRETCFMRRSFHIIPIWHIKNNLTVI